jgi:hypothetical protein
MPRKRRNHPDEHADEPKASRFTRTQASIALAGGLIAIVGGLLAIPPAVRGLWDWTHPTERYRLDVSGIHVTRKISALAALQDGAHPCPEARSGKTMGVEVDVDGTGTGTSGAKLRLHAAIELAHGPLLVAGSLDRCYLNITHDEVQPSMTVKFWFPDPAPPATYAVRVSVGTTNEKDLPAEYHSPPFASA